MSLEVTCVVLYIIMWPLTLLGYEIEEYSISIGIIHFTGNVTSEFE
jgi:hypothetical protein